MKIKIRMMLVTGLAVLTVAGPALGVGLNAYDGKTYVDMLLPTVMVPADAIVTNTGSAINVAPYKGIAAIRVQITGNLVSNNYGGHVVIQSSSNGSTLWTNVASLAKNVVGLTTNVAGETFKVDLQAQKAYLRAVFYASNAVSASATATLVVPQ